MPAETHVEQGPLDRNAVFAIVRDNLADILEIEPSTISEGQSFVDDLEADSLALIELVEADIVAVPGNPLDDINALEKVRFVMKGGIVFRR